MTINISTKISEKVKYKKNLLLHTIRQKGTSERLEIARKLHFSNSRVCDLVQEMLDGNLLTEERTRLDRRGRRGIPIKVNPDYGQFVGFDMEAKRLRLILVDFSGKII